MKKLTSLLAVASVAAVLTACGQSPTSPQASADTVRFDAGHTLGAEHNVAPDGGHGFGSGGVTTSSGGHTIGSGNLAAEETTVAQDSVVSRGGHTIGSGN